MKRLLLCYCLVVACSRSIQKDVTDTFSFYVTDQNNNVYEYSNKSISMMSKKVNSMARTTMNSIQLTTSYGFNVIHDNGDVLNEYFPNSTAVASVMSDDFRYVYYVTTDGYLHRFDSGSETSISLNKRLYPVPRQMVYYNNAIYYHDNSQVYRLDLSSMTNQRLMNEYMLIQSIALDKVNGAVYFSNATDGKIYIIQNKHSILIHNSLSARGSSIDIDGRDLYYTRNVGRGIQINKLNLDTNENSELLSIFQFNSVQQLIVKSP
jgi:hypothetical protein